MELGNRRETAFDHFDESHSRDGFDIIWRQIADEPIHRLSPRPEMIVLGTATLGQSCKTTLKRMAMHIAHAWERDAFDAIRIRRLLDIGFDTNDLAATQRQENAVAPTVLKEGAIEKQLVHKRLRTDSAAPL
jgi:hypothetical protein